jgi:hypothetical protein
MGKMADVIRCRRLKNESIFERECEFQSGNHFCYECLSELLKQNNNQSEYFWDIYTKYPPNRFFNNAEEVTQMPGHIASCDLPPDIMADLEIKKDNFKKTGNPVYALEAFLEADKAGLYPHRWVISWLLRAFRSFQKSNGKGNLNQLLGFKKGKGKRTIGFKEIEIQKRNYELLYDVSTLQAIFDFKVEDACKMVEKRINKKLSWRTMLDLYGKDAWHKKHTHLMRRHFKWSEEEKREYLKQYPSDSYEWRRGKLKLRMK